MSLFATTKGTRRSALHATALGCVLGSGAACAELPSDDVRLNVITWWQEKAEQDAFSQVIALHRRTHPGVSVEPSGDGSGQTSRNAVAHRMLVRAPLATFQANAGADLLRWVAVDYERDQIPRSEVRLLPLGGLFEREGIERSDFHAGLFENVEFHGQVYGLPLNVHRLNMLYYDVAAQRRFVEEYGRDFTADLGVLCPEDPRDRAPRLPTLAVGAASPFVLTLLTFENILPALTSGSFYESLWKGESPASSTGGPWTDDVRRALRCLKHLSSSFNNDYQRIDWARATDYVAEGRAAFTVMGDWVDGRHARAIGGSVEGVPFPGTGDLFVYTSDTFPLPSHTEHRAEAEAFLATLASAQAQRDFSAAKGSIPARRDVELSGRARLKRDAFERATPVLATSGFFPYYFPAVELEAALNEMVRADAPANAEDRVIAFLVNAHPLLDRWRRRQEAPLAAP